MCLEYIALLSWTYSFPKTISDYTDFFFFFDYTDLSICYLIRRDFPTRFTDYILKILFFLYELSSSNWKWGPATHLSKAGKEARLVERKVWWVGVGEECLSKGLLPPADNQWAGAVTHRGRGLHAEHSQLWQPSWNWSCSGLTNIILMVLGTVSLQFRRGLSHFLEVKFQNCGSLCHDWLPRCGQWQRICLPMQETWEMWVWSLGQEDPLGWEDPHENLHGQRSLAGCSPRGRKESDTIEATYHTTHTHHGYSLVIMELISSTCRGFQYLQDSSQDTAQNTVDSSWGGTKCFWLCLMTKLLLCGMWSPLSFFVSAFSHFSD